MTMDAQFNSKMHLLRTFFSFFGANSCVFGFKVGKSVVRANVFIYILFLNYFMGIKNGEFEADFDYVENIAKNQEKKLSIKSNG
jgi:hypothetical protein